MAVILVATPVVLAMPESVQEAHAIGTGITGPLTVRGNQILDDGKPTYLRGINRDSFEQFGSYGSWPDNKMTASYDFADIKRIRSYNINIVRVPLGSQYWLPNQPPCQEHDLSYVHVVDELVNWITSQHMVALLDLHTEVPPGTILCPGNGGQHLEPAPDTNAVPFWQQVAARYKSNPLVAFELFNEPHYMSTSSWLNGGALNISGSLAPFVSTGMQRLYDTVRGTGATNLVFIDGTDYAGNPAPIENDPVRGTNIVYAQHVYTCTVVPTTKCGTDPAPAINLWATVRAHYPVVMTEFGWPDVTSATFNQNVVNDVERLQPPDTYAGWLGFDWGGRRPTAGFNPFGIFSSWSYTGCPNNCREVDIYPTDPPGDGSPLINYWALNS
jgi:hypothetical protein